MKQPGFFDVEERLARLSGLDEQLKAFSRTVNFEVFRSDLEKALLYPDGIKRRMSAVVSITDIQNSGHSDHKQSLR